MGPKLRMPLLHSAFCQRVWQLWQSSSYIVTYCCVIASVVVCSVVVVLQVYALFTAKRHGVDVGSAQSRSNGMGYAIVVDAGSSGSRGYVYMWPPHSGNRQDLLSIQPLKDNEGRAVMHAISPGLSSLRGKPEQAAVYLEPILDFASTRIPAEKHRETPLYVMATAGMRLLNASEQEAIISSLRTGIQAKYPFIVATNNIQVITGREEGIYQWIAVNFALNRFRHSWDGPLVTVNSVGDESVRRLQTVGAVDMGGASMQIAFEVVDKTQEEALGDQRSALAVINLGCADHDHEHTYKLYVRTFLGYGANEMYRRHRDAVRASVTNTTRRLYDPCLVRDYVDAPLNRTDALCRHPTLLPSVKNQTLPPSICTVPVTGTGDWHMCETALIKQIRDERVNRQCSTESEVAGSAAGRQLHPSSPALCTRTLDQLPAGVGSPETFGFSEFWYSMEDTLRVGGKYHYSSYKQTASDYCETSWSTVARRLRQGLYGAGADADRLSRQCFKSVYVTAALHEGLGVSRDYAGFTSSPSQVAGRVASWTLGALLYKLRFLPVRSVEQVQFSHFHAVTTGVWGSQYWLLVCVLVVAAVLLLYARRIRRMRSRRYSTETPGQKAPLLYITSQS